MSNSAADGKAGQHAELHISVNTGRKMRRLVFITKHAVELEQTISQELEALVGREAADSGVRADGFEYAAGGAFSSVGAEEYLTIDGVVAPFDVALFGPTSAAQSGCPAIGGSDPEHHSADLSGTAFVFRRRSAHDYSMVRSHPRAPVHLPSQPLQRQHSKGNIRFWGSG